MRRERRCRALAWRAYFALGIDARTPIIAMTAMDDFVSKPWQPPGDRTMVPVFRAGSNYGENVIDDSAVPFLKS